MSSILPLTRLSTLTDNSQIYSQNCMKDNFYYEEFQINVPEIRTYTIWSSSNIDTYGFIYENSFDPLNPRENSFEQNDNGYTNGQFKFELPFYSDTTYILVVTKKKSKDIDNITINLSGVNNVIIKNLSKFKYCIVNNQYKMRKVFAKSI
jgi:hypothetical protein